MDFSYFTSAPQPYQFFGLSPSPSTAQDNQLAEFPLDPSMGQYDAAFAAVQPRFHYDPSTFLAQPHPTSAQEQPSFFRDSVTTVPEMDMNNLTALDLAPDDPALGRSSSEEKDSTTTTQQSKRKEQNRAAQRAFRERKERHLKELEAKLNRLQHQSVALNGENERLRRELARMATENEILRATSGPASNGPTPFLEQPDELVGPLGFVPTDRLHSKDHSPADSTGSTFEPGSKYAQFGTPRAIPVDRETGDQLLGAGATWDYIQAHELFRNGLVDVGDVCERLKKMARCDGQGPIFLESDIRKAIAESAVAGGRDELI
ncbi:hypothetical protein A1O3_09080 [Capronia epimyces CBS 606.96]|uniref:BZIP domain-containing protein n=1 Tax=Capronia epimyces CBS 606.96 TaxID=1182542 RepID=W9XLT5_9EURO|nr:uncharacterized protein A1O3_09080 [Capronia epimyces CBS 606.96]EXJ77921.1 hypothetical protein A1O3_09080 [Capronia epimyces CBS 606.96]